MIQVFADNTLTYDSRLPAYSLLALSYTAGLNKAGTATIKMRPGHPAYDAYKIFKTTVTIYDDGVLVFRGRPLKPDDDMLNRRTITCEGERCFFRDAVLRPTIYQADPTTVLSEVIAEYNSQVKADRQFVVGTVTVTDPNDYIRLENTRAEKISATIDRLVERCGGYIVFTSNADGARVVNWYAAVNYSNNQTIEFGSNLTDFSRTTENLDLITRIIPYGAQDETTGEYITIESVNDGKDYIEDAEAIALRGIITDAVYWDDVTEPSNLLRKAEERLATRRNLITGLTLTAVDLSVLGVSAIVAGEAIAGKKSAGSTLNPFREGDLIRVKSRPHNLDDSFLLTDRSVDLLNKGASAITLGKETKTLTGLSSAGNRHNQNEMNQVERQIRTDYTLNIANAVEEAQALLTSLIEQTSEAIKMEVSESYATTDGVTEAISTSMTQLSDSFTFTFNELQTLVDANDAAAREHIIEQENYIRFEDGDIILGASDSPITLTIENDMIVFRKNGAQLGWWDGTDFHTGNIVVTVEERAQFGNFAFVPRSNGSLSFLKVSG